MTPQELLQKYDLKLTYVFVPYSQSRNADRWESLNWSVTLHVKDREVMTFDYSAGVAFCPANKWSDKHLKKVGIKQEIENGKPSRKGYGDRVYTDKRKPLIEPRVDDVIYSLVSDSDVLNYTGFQDWAENFGYSVDSISAKAIYDSCMETALYINGHLGRDFFDDAQLAFEDF